MVNSFGCWLKYNSCSVHWPHYSIIVSFRMNRTKLHYPAELPAKPIFKRDVEINEIEMPNGNCNLLGTVVLFIRHQLENILFFFFCRALNSPSALNCRWKKRCGLYAIFKQNSFAYALDHFDQIDKFCVIRKCVQFF